MTDAFLSPFKMSYQIGVLLAASAIRDAYLVVDGPNCTMFRASHLQGNHDWCADLFRADGFHRVADTDATTERLALGDDRLLRERLQQVAARPDCGLVLLGAMSPAAMTGRQYDRQVRELRARVHLPVAFVPCGSLTSDWLAGYAAVLQTLAENLPCEAQADPRRERVAVVGHLMHRQEADLRADVAELERLISGLGLEPAGVWLEGGPAADLLRSASAGTVVSLPYGRAAARILAERVGARLLECELPLGLDACKGFLASLATATGRERSLEGLLERELRRAAGRLEWLLPHHLQGKRVALVADPHAGAALASAVEEFGCQVCLTAYWAAAERVEAEERVVPGRLLIDPSPALLLEALAAEAEGAGLDLVILNAHALRQVAGLLVSRGIPFVEWGFPAYHTHALVDTACLGIQGTLHLAEVMSNALSHQAILRECRPEPGG